MEERDSSYWGCDYYLAKSAYPFAKTIKLHRNKDIYDQKPIFGEYTGFDIILHFECVIDEPKLRERPQTDELTSLIESSSEGESSA